MHEPADKPVDLRKTRDLWMKELQTHLEEMKLLKKELAAKPRGDYLARLQVRRQLLSDRIRDVQGRLSWMKTQRGQRTLPEYFMETCKKELDTKTFNYLLGQALKLKEECL